MASKNSSVNVYKEGLLLKRSRGLHSNKRQKFQERYCRLTSKSLDYYDPRKMSELKGQFRLGSIRIVEILPHGTFGEKFKSHAFQVGDNSEVMYFAAKSPQERSEWMDAFRRIARERTNSMLSTYHPGVYGLHIKDRWSCCGRTLRECDGCMNAVGTMKALGMDITTPVKAKPRSYTTPLDLDVGTAVEVGSLATEKSMESLSESIKSDTSDSTLIETGEDTTMRRTFTICSIDRPSSQKNTSSGTLLARTTPSPDSGTSGSLEENETDSSSSKAQKSPRLLPTDELKAIPNDLQTQDGATRSGASSPALSTDSGRGTSNSRPNSMIDHSTSTESLPSYSSRSESFGRRSNLSVIQDETGKMSESEHGAPLTPRSIKSNATTDSDRDSLGPTKAMGVEVSNDGQRRHGDTLSMISDISTLSGYSTLSHPSHHHVNRRRPDRQRPMSYCREWPVVSMCVDRRDSDGSFVESATNKLHQACKDGNLAVVMDELDTGAPVCGAELFNGLPMLPLFIAFLHDHWQVIKYLLEHDADPNAIDIGTRSCLLHWACQKGCTDIVQLLIDHKADVNMRNHEECTPLSEASKNGHLDIVEILLNKGASVDSTGANNQTALHFAAAAGHEEIVELLLAKEANPLKRSSQHQTPYDLAYLQKHMYVMSVLQEYLPKEMRAYKHRHSTELPSCQAVSSLCFLPDKTGSKKRLLTGSWDCTATVWSDNLDNGLTVEHQFKLPNTVLGISCHSHFAAMGSTSVQLTDTENFEWRRTVADDSHEDESLEDPPLHLVLYSPTGDLVSAGVESNVVKIWPPTSLDTIPQPTSRLTFKDKKSQIGCIYRLAISPCVSEPWLAVVVQPGHIFSPHGSKKIHVYNLKEKKVFHVFDAGHGGTEVGVHVAFSPNGRYLVIGCKDKIVKWENASGKLVRSISLEKGDDITALLYSPSGVHLTVGLSSGQVKVIDGELRSTLFVLQKGEEESPVTSLAYSEDGSILATGHHWGAIHLWDAML